MFGSIQYKLSDNQENHPLLSEARFITHQISWVHRIRFFPNFLSSTISDSYFISQLLKNFETFYGTRRFMTVFTRARDWSLSWAKLMKSIPPHSISLKFILLLHSQLRLALLSGIFPSTFSNKILYVFRLCFHACYLSCPSYPPWLYYSNCVWRSVKCIKLLFYSFSVSQYMYNCRINIQFLQLRHFSATIFGHHQLVHIQSSTTWWWQKIIAETCRKCRNCTRILQLYTYWKLKRNKM
jgi:hypothetical protein